MPTADTQHETLSISLAAGIDAAVWDDYVRAHPAGTVFHLRAWSDAVEAAYGHRRVDLVATAGDRLVGVLPLASVRSRFVGHVLVSNPCATYGGVLADSEDVARALAERAFALCGELGARYVELRHREPVGLDLPVLDRYDTFRRELPSDPDEILSWLPRKARAAARKGGRDFGEQAVEFGPHLLEEVYRLYAVSMRRLGSPNYSLRLWRGLAEGFGDDCVATVIRVDGQPVGGVLSFVFRDEIIPYYQGGVEGLPRNANNLLYWKLMDWAVRRGLRWFDFNRTRRDNAGPYDFKRHHGFEPSPLCYQVWMADGGPLPNLSPSNRKFALAGRLWRRLPLWITRPAGARVTRWIP